MNQMRWISVLMELVLRNTSFSIGSILKIFKQLQQSEKYINIIKKAGTLMSLLHKQATISTLDNNSVKSYTDSNKYKINKPDIQLVFSDQIYSVHCDLILHCGHLRAYIQKGDKSIIMKLQSLSEVSDSEVKNIIESILLYIYTQNLDIPRNNSLMNYVRAGKELDLPSFIKAVQNQIINKFNEFQLFTLYNIAVGQNLENILQKCNKELVASQFKHLESQSQNLWQLNKKSFEKIVDFHAKMKRQFKIKGLDNIKICEIVKKYETMNKCQLSLSSIKICQSIEKSDSSSKPNTSNQFNELKNRVYLNKKYSFPQAQKKFTQNCIQSVGKDSRESKQQQSMSPSNKNIKSKNQIFLDFDVVESPIVNLQDLNEQIATFGQWGTNQDNKFMSIEQANQIAQRDSEDQDDQYQKSHNQQSINENLKNQLQKQQLRVVPQINKHFVV